MTTFTVSDVELSRERLPAATVASALQLQVGSPIEAGSINLPDLVELPAGTDWEPAPQNLFVHVAHAAFARHHPLVLSPDDVWLCLAQGFARHVHENAEALRDRFVQHEGTATLLVRRDEFVKGSPDNDWPGCFAEFSSQIAGHVGKKRDLVVADFSTTGPVEQAASEIVLMSAMQRYFKYEVHSLCGIPEITLLGTTEDYRSIRRRVEAFAEFDLGWWTKALIPVLDHFVAASQGRVDRAFWQSFYKVKSESGGPYASGWINTLFPYLNVEVYKNNELGHAVQRNPHVARWAKGLKDEIGGGPKLGDFPVGVSMAPFLWNYLGEEAPMELFGGFGGASQAPESLALRPAIGWAVRGAGA
jgi:hypothetical protein